MVKYFISLARQLGNPKAAQVRRMTRLAAPTTLPLCSSQLHLCRSAAYYCYRSSLSVPLYDILIYYSTRDSFSTLSYYDCPTSHYTSISYTKAKILAKQPGLNSVQHHFEASYLVDNRFAHCAPRALRFTSLQM